MAQTRKGNTEEERTAEEEAAEVTGPGAEERGVEEPREEVEETREPVAEIPQEKAVPEERPPLKGAVLTQCMQDPSFRRRVIHHIVKKLQ